MVVVERINPDRRTREIASKSIFNHSEEEYLA